MTLETNGNGNGFTGLLKRINGYGIKGVVGTVIVAITWGAIQVREGVIKMMDHQANQEARIAFLESENRRIADLASKRGESLQAVDQRFKDNEQRIKELREEILILRRVRP